MRESQVSTEDKELRFRIFIGLWLQTVKGGVVLDSSGISPRCIFRNMLPIGWFSFKICNQKAFPNPYPLRTSNESHSCFALSAEYKPHRLFRLCSCGVSVITFIFPFNFHNAQSFRSLALVMSPLVPYLLLCPLLNGVVCSLFVYLSMFLLIFLFTYLYPADLILLFKKNPWSIQIHSGPTWRCEIKSRDQETNQPLSPPILVPP